MPRRGCVGGDITGSGHIEVGELGGRVVGGVANFKREGLSRPGVEGLLQVAVDILSSPRACDRGGARPNDECIYSSNDLAAGEVKRTRARAVDGCIHAAQCDIAAGVADGEIVKRGRGRAADGLRREDEFEVNDGASN